jgi:hypothetical protein
MTKRTMPLLGALAGLVLPCLAFAQNPQPAPPQATQTPTAPPSTSQPPPEQITPRHGTLSDQLSQRQGTVRPPTVDPGITAPLPSNARGTMPVIPPPGTPGGNQAVVPK